MTNSIGYKGPRGRGFKGPRRAGFGGKRGKC